MKLRLIREKFGQVGVAVAVLVFCAFAFAVGLSVAPQLHESLHNLDGSNHQCAATLLSSGSLEHSACEPTLIAPSPAPPLPAFRTQLFQGALALLEFSRLEHAPPARS